MGLAASQSRFLAITARKANCEYQSMNYAQQKLSITRQLANATADYENSLSATKLIWNASGSENQIVDLSYELMMKPSPLNAYNPYMVTNTAGRIVLDEKYAKAAEAAGIGRKGSPNTREGRDAFVKALADQGLISGSMAEVVQANDYVPNAGCGAEPLDKTASNAVTLGGFANYLSNSGFTLGLDNIFTNYQTDWYKTGSRVDRAGTVINQGDFKRLTMGDLLTSNITLSSTAGKDEFATQIKQIIEVIADDLGRNSMEFKGLFTDEESQRALEEAYQITVEQFSAGSRRAQDAGGSKSIQARNAANLARKINGIAYSHDSCAVSLTNLMSTFLTAYAQSLVGYECGYSIRPKAEDSVYVTEDPSYYYLLYNEGSIASQKDLLYTDFYNIMYNNICSNGWTTIDGGDVNDQDYLSHALKNGQLFVSSLNTDGYYYQGAYTENGYIEEVTDDDKIAVAQAEYNKIKTNLSYKEERIELEMQNLDLEISSLTTEYDTVKQLISKSVEKTFSMFSS